MDINKFREVIKERIRISTECQDEWDYGIEQCWNQEVDILTEDIVSTIEFLENDCTADEYSWISEVLEKVVEQKPSKELVDCYRSLMSKYPEECEKYNIKGVVEIADNIIYQENNNGEES